MWKDGGTLCLPHSVPCGGSIHWSDLLGCVSGSLLSNHLLENKFSSATRSWG